MFRHHSPYAGLWDLHHGLRWVLESDQGISMDWELWLAPMLRR